MSAEALHCLLLSRCIVYSHGLAHNILAQAEALWALLGNLAILSSRRLREAQCTWMCKGSGCTVNGWSGVHMRTACLACQLAAVLGGAGQRQAHF